MLFYAIEFKKWNFESSDESANMWLKMSTKLWIIEEISVSLKQCKIYNKGRISSKRLKGEISWSQLIEIILLNFSYSLFLSSSKLSKYEMYISNALLRSFWFVDAIENNDEIIIFESIGSAWLSVSVASLIFSPIDWRISVILI